MNSTVQYGENPDRDDPLFLFSQSLDGPLTVKEQARLDEALAGSPALQAQAAELAWVHGLILESGNDVPEIDSPIFVELATATAACDDDAALAVVDRWLDSYGEEPPEVDSDAFVRSVLAGVATSPIRRAARPWTLRPYVSLAAAASVLLAVIGYMGYRSDPQDSARLTGRTIVTYDQMAGARVADASQGGTRKNIVAYAMTEPDRAGASARWSSRSDRVEIIVVGSDVRGGWSEPLPPL